MRKSAAVRFFLLLCVAVLGAISCASDKVELYPIRENNRVGYINKIGQVIIPPQFAEAGFFSYGLAKVGVGKKYGYINEKGEFAINPQFDSAQRFSEGLAAVKVNGKWGFINKDGQMVIDVQFDDPSPSNGSVMLFSEGVVPVSSGGKWGYIDKNGKYVIEPKFTSASVFSDGLALVFETRGSDDGVLGFIDKGGKYVGNPQTTSKSAPVQLGGEYAARYFSEFDSIKLHLPLAIRKDSVVSEGNSERVTYGRYGYINAEGEYVISPQYKTASDFAEGLAAVEKGNKWGFIDEKGNMIIAPQFSGTGIFSEGLAPVLIGDNSVSIDLSNSKVIEKTDVEKTKWGFIDKTGKMVINPQFDRVEVPFINGLAFVHKENSYGWIDKTGKLVWQAKK